MFLESSYPINLNITYVSQDISRLFQLYLWAWENQSYLYVKFDLILRV